MSPFISLWDLVDPKSGTKVSLLGTVHGLRFPHLFTTSWTGSLELFSSHHLSRTRVNTRRDWFASIRNTCSISWSLQSKIERLTLGLPIWFSHHVLLRHRAKDTETPRVRSEHSGCISGSYAGTDFTVALSARPLIDNRLSHRRGRRLKLLNTNCAFLYVRILNKVHDHPVTQVLSLSTLPSVFIKRTWLELGPMQFFPKILHLERAWIIQNTDTLSFRR